MAATSGSRSNSCARWPGPSTKPTPLAGLSTASTKPFASPSNSASMPNSPPCSLRAASLGAAGRIEEASATASRSRAGEAELESEQDLGHVAALWRARVHALAGDLDSERTEIAAAHERLTRLLTPFPADVRTRSEQVVAEHSEIIERHALHYPRIQLVYLAPEAQHDGERRVPVRWTVHHPDDLDARDRTTRRRRRLARLLDEARGQHGHPRLADLAEALETSVSTLKRDMASLRAEGRL